MYARNRKKLDWFVCLRQQDSSEITQLWTYFLQNNTMQLPKTQVLGTITHSSILMNIVELWKIVYNGSTMCYMYEVLHTYTLTMFNFFT